METKNVSEFETKKILRENGIETPQGMVLKELPKNHGLKFPLVLKVSDPNILHKSDVGGVKLGIRDTEALNMAFNEMRKKFPKSEFVLEETVPSGVEFIAGVISDPVFGHVIMLGSGGIYTELFKDVTFRKIPISRADAEDMVRTIRTGEFCKGFRGIRIDCEKLADFLLKLSRLVSSGRYMVESMDINPVIVSENAAVAADAKLAVRV